MSELHFAQIREDGRLERSLQARFRPRRILAVGSGGCTALSLLDDDVEAVYAVDVSPAQCALIELRKVAIEELAREDYLAFVGDAPSTGRVATYSRLAPRLPVEARRHWDARPSLVATGVSHAGTTERFYRFLGENLRQSVVPDEVWHALLACTTLDAQAEIAARHFEGEAWRTALRVLLSRTTHLAFFPAFMFAQADEHDFGEFFAAQFARELARRPMAGNYFLSQLVFGSYLLDRPDGTPAYLSPEGYRAAQRNLCKLRVVCASLQDFLPHAEPLDAFFLSNAFDWAPPAERERITSGILAAHRPGARLLLRHMLVAPSLPASLAARVRVDTALGDELHGLERSMLYRAVTVAELA